MLITMKEKIAAVLNEHNIKTNVFSKVVNGGIISLILLLVVLTILEVDPKFQNYRIVFESIDFICIIIFSIEYVLRLWTADLISERYNGFSGRLRYMFSFYALIDLAAILPYLLSMSFLGISWQASKVLRVIRILRLARYMKSFDFIVKATRNKRAELFISLQIVILLTFVLSVLLYHVENVAQPNHFSSIWAAMLWSFSKFIGDIGGYGDFSPVTPVGMLLATGVGILSIAIFAVPAGIIASGFVEEIENEKKTKEINERVRLLEASFTPRINSFLGILVPIRKRTLPIIQARLNFTDNEIFEAVRSSSQLRIKWDKSDSSVKIFDTIVLEHFIPNTAYGVRRINEGSNIHIINPIGRGERSISHFTNTLADYGGFNFISNECFSSGELIDDIKYQLDINPDLANDTINGPLGAQIFCEDLKQFIKKRDWVFVVRSASSHHENNIHIHFGGAKGQLKWEEIQKPTITDEASFKKLLEKLKQQLGELGYKAGTHEYYSNDNPNLLHQYIFRHTGANVITLFISIDELSSEDRFYYNLIKGLADCLKEI